MDSFFDYPVTLLIICVNVLVSLAGFSNETLIRKLIFNPYQIHHKKEYYRLITSGFIHADWGHLLFNMFSFYFFGRLLELYFSHPAIGLERSYSVDQPFVGNLVFLLFYLVALVVSSLPDLLQKNSHAHFNSLGASGAVNAVIFGTILFGPWELIYVYFIPVPALVFGLLYLGYTYYASKTGRQAGINHNAHFFGALFGIVATIALVPDSLSVFLQQIGQGLPY